jgi:hypothetical protein
MVYLRVLTAKRRPRLQPPTFGPLWVYPLVPLPCDSAFESDEKCDSADSLIHSSAQHQQNSRSETATHKPPQHTTCHSDHLSSLSLTHSHLDHARTHAHAHTSDHTPHTRTVNSFADRVLHVCERTNAPPSSPTTVQRPLAEMDSDPEVEEVPDDQRWDPEELQVCHPAAHPPTHIQ